MPARFVIVTGMSGAGKSTALDVLEDVGYYCIDNMPIPLIGKFTELVIHGESRIDRIAMGIDIRSGKALPQLMPELDRLQDQGVHFEILFLSADDAALVKRYKETRRSHPLARDGRLESGIREERKQLKFLRERADYIIDTSQLLTRELKGELEKIFVENRKFGNLMITILSFGFKYGIPQDADLVFDVRFLPNPYYVAELKKLTGREEPVRQYVMRDGVAEEFLDKLTEMILFLIPNYVKESRNQLVIAVGCTGGRHRSVVVAEELYRRLSEAGQSGLRLDHRDMEKDPVRKGM